MPDSTVEQTFWNWFLKREERLFNLDFSRQDERESLFDELASQLHKVHPDLTFEVGPTEAIREFVISAGGLKRAFPAVVELTKAAPSLSRWKFTAFRPRRSPTIVEFRGQCVDPKDVQFSLLDNGRIAGLYLFFPGFRDNDADLKQIGYLLLDEALGEYDVETRLGLIKMMSPDEPTSMKRHPFAQLPKLFDQLVAALEGHSKKPF